MSIENRSLLFSSSISDLTPVNSSFDKGVLAIAYHGESRNKTYIGKDEFENAIPSLFNCPIVCTYNRETDSIGSHDMEIVKDANGIRLVNLTTPVGVIPESAKTWWANVEEDDGTVHEYLMAECLIWKRQEAYQHIRDNGITDESMEIKIFQSKREEDGLVHIYSFEFTAFCLLESAKPCFESAGLELFAAHDFKSQYAAMIDDMKREFAQVMTASADDIDNQFLLKGGNERVDMNELLAKYGLSAEDINFETDGVEPEELEQRFAQLKSEKDNANFEAEAPAEDEPENTEEHFEIEQPQEPEQAPAEEETFSLTANQLDECLRSALREVKWFDQNWNEQRCRYYMVDFDMQSNEVYAHDVQAGYLVGMSFAMDGDKPVINFESAKRKKIVYQDFEDGVPFVDLSAVFEAVCNEVEARYQSVTEELETLRKFKADFDAAERKDAENKVFAAFAELEGNEMFESLKSNCSEMTIEQIEDKCFSIRGRVNSAQSASFSLNPEKTIQLPVEQTNTTPTDEPYGGLFVRYGVGNQ